MPYADLFKTIALATVACGTATLLVVGALTLTPDKAEANPTFAQKTGRGCPTCHTAPPKLNGTGQKFKANGYKL